MSVNVNTYAAITEEQKIFYQKALLKRLIPTLHAYEDAQKSNLPLNSGLTVNWRRFESLAITDTELSEGVTPDGKSLQVTAITAKITKSSAFISLCFLFCGFCNN